MPYLLDTNACIALIKGQPLAVRSRLDRALRDGTEVLVSAVVAFELWYGAEKSTLKAENRKRLEAFFSGNLRIAAFEEQDAVQAGRLRAALESSGKPIGPFDLLIAGQALSRQCTLVTANTREFARVPNLVWEDWARA